MEKAVKNKNLLLFWMILLVAVLSRIAMFGIVPGGLNQDEAYSGYEAFSLLNFGVDSWGYQNSVYFTAWGDGLNALNSYLTIPFMAILGAKVWVIRIPQLIVGIISIVIVYKLMKYIFDIRTGLWAMFFMSICPWHIMLCRWGLESNLLPGFILFGTYAFILALNNSKFYLLSGVMYGLSLYCYAAVWPILPLIILLGVIYCIYTNQLKVDKFAICGALILFILAIPLMLFLAVNYGFMEEIRTNVISIPKMVLIRSGDISLKHIPKYFLHMMKVLILQNDNLIWNSTKEFGLYYHGMLLFGAIGFVYVIKRVIKSLKNRVFDGVTLILIQFIGGLILGCIVDIVANRINIIHIPIVILIVLGIVKTIEYLKVKLKKVEYIFIFVLASAFICFEIFYYTEYRDRISYAFQDGIYQAISYAESKTAGEIYVSNGIGYPKVAYSGHIPTDEYIETWMPKRPEHLDCQAVGRFILNTDKPHDGKVYVIEEKDIETFEREGFGIEEFGMCAVAYK